MSDWNPSLYLHFAAERSRPAVELLARVPLENVEYVADLGCGPGNSTALLQQRWPAARITGIDSSPAMIAEARSALPDCQFVEADIRNWQPVQALDLIFANASLQWLPDHYELFPHLVSLLNPQGVLAVQMPDNPLHLPNPAMSFLPRAVTTVRQSSTAPKVFALQRNGRTRHYYENQEKWRWRHREC